MKKLITLAAIFVLVIPLLSFAQEPGNIDENRASLHHEVPGDAYLPPSDQTHSRSPGYISRGSNIFTIQVNVDEYGDNIIGDAANEPSIAVDPTDPSHMVIGWRQFDNVSSDFRQAGWGYTDDAGLSWTFPGTIETGVFRSDPVLDANAEGTIYYNSLSSSSGQFLCHVFRSIDGGASWDDGVLAKGGDKQWMVIDRSGGVGDGNIYSFWTVFYSSCFPGSFTRSINGGNSYQSCIQVMGYPQWGTMAVGPDGELYIVGEGEDEGVVVVKSVNAQDPSAVISWDFSEQVFLDGHLTGSTPINPAGLLGQADIGVDCSDGPGRGNVYVLASVERPAGGDPADVMFSRSTDGGITWNLIPVRINDDPENDHYQWFGTMSGSFLLWLMITSGTGAARPDR